MIEIISIPKLVISIIIFGLIYFSILIIGKYIITSLLDYWAKRKYAKEVRIYECKSPGQYCRRCKSENLEIIEDLGSYLITCKKCGHQDCFGKELLVLFGIPLPKRIREFTFKEKRSYLYKNK